MISQEPEEVSRWMKKCFKEEGSTLLMTIGGLTGNYYLQSYDDSKFWKLFCSLQNDISRTRRSIEMNESILKRKIRRFS